MRIDYHPAVAAELEEIRDYYNQQSFGLGSEFADEFERQILLIASMPERWMIAHKDIRRSVMKRFPYIIFFRISEKQTLRITLVKHEKRHPAFGLGRR